MSVISLFLKQFQMSICLHSQALALTMPFGSVLDIECTAHNNITANEIRLYQRCIDAKCKQLKSNHGEALSISSERQLKRHHASYCVTSKDSSFHCFSFERDPFNQGQVEKANRKYGSATEIK